MLKQYEARYQRWSRFIRQYPKAAAFICLINKSMTYIFYGWYPVFLGILAYEKDPRLKWCILIPAISFVVLSAIRRLINRPRPYTSLDIQPLIQKSDVGESMPSRHVFSATMIAMTVYAVFPVLGAVLMGLAVILAVVRVLAGVHYPSDVSMGMLSGVLCGFVLFFFTS